MYRHHRIAHQEIERTGQRWIEAQLNRVRGELLIRHKPAEIAAAGDAFMRSVAVARRQQTKTFELQAATSLARLWRDQGKAKEARELLAPNAFASFRSRRCTGSRRGSTRGCAEIPVHTWGIGGRRRAGVAICSGGKQGT